MKEFNVRDLINYGRYKHIKKHIEERLEQLYELSDKLDEEECDDGTKERVMWEIEALERRLEKYKYI